MGAGLALYFSKAISRLDRQESKPKQSSISVSRLNTTAIMPSIGGWPSDCSNLVASQFAAKNYYTGELSGARHVLGQGNVRPLSFFQSLIQSIGLQNLQKDSPAESSMAELVAFKSQMAEAVSFIRKRIKPFSVPEIRRLLLRAVSVLVASPKVIQ